MSNVARFSFRANGGTTGPAAYSTKLNEWEQLRVCTDGTVFADMFVIYNQVATGGSSMLIVWRYATCPRSDVYKSDLI